MQRYVELCAVGALECGDLAPLLSVGQTRSRKATTVGPGGLCAIHPPSKSGVVSPHFKARFVRSSRARVSL